MAEHADHAARDPHQVQVEEARYFRFLAEQSTARTPSRPVSTTISSDRPSIAGGS